MNIQPIFEKDRKYRITNKHSKCFESIEAVHVYIEAEKEKLDMLKEFSYELESIHEKFDELNAGQTTRAPRSEN